MNRYVAKGLLEDASSGERVLYLALTLDQADYALHELAREIRSRGDDVRWSVQVSRRYIWHANGGCITLSSVAARRSLEGLIVDRLFLDAPTFRLSDQQRDLVTRIAGLAKFGGDSA